MNEWVTFRDMYEDYQTRLRVDIIESISIKSDLVRVITAKFVYWIGLKESPDDYRMMVDLAGRLAKEGKGEFWDEENHKPV